MADLSELLGSATCVLFDFDGPVCRLFAGHPARRVAADLVGWLEERQLGGLLTVEEAGSADPHAVLRAVARAHPGSGLVTELEARLTEHELLAAAGAEPTAFADELIPALRSRDYKLAVTTNNSASVVRRYLEPRGLLDCFGPHIHGRTQDPLRLKPDPDCLLRALDSTGASATSALMIGDTRADCEAACKAGVAFVGYGRDTFKEAALRAAGATTVVPSMGRVLEAVLTRKGR